MCLSFNLRFKDGLVWVMFRIGSDLDGFGLRLDLGLILGF